MNVTERIDTLLYHKRLSRRKVAIMAGISTTTFQSAMQRNGDMTISMIKKVADALEVSPAWLCGWDETKVWRKDMDNNSAIAMLGSIANTVMDPEKMKAFEEKRMKDEARNQKIDDLTVRAVETMIHLMDKIDERIQNSELTNEQLISLSGAMMTVSTSMGMLRAGMGWGYNGCHV